MVPAPNSMTRPRHPLGLALALWKSEACNWVSSRATCQNPTRPGRLLGDGAVAVAMARVAPYALILMDLQMPVMGGDDACRAIRQLPEHAATPIVALSASVFEEDRKRCLAAGMDDHLTKPIRSQQLFDTLLKWLPTPR